MGGAALKELSQKLSPLSVSATLLVVVILAFFWWFESVTMGAIEQIPKILEVAAQFTHEMNDLNGNLKKLGDGPVAVQLGELNGNLDRHAESAERIAEGIAEYQSNFGTIGDMVRDLSAKQEQGNSYLKRISDGLETLPGDTARELLRSAEEAYPTPEDRYRFNGYPGSDADNHSLIYPDDDFGVNG